MPYNEFMQWVPDLDDYRRRREAEMAQLRAQQAAFNRMYQGIVPPIPAGLDPIPVNPIPQEVVVENVIPPEDKEMKLLNPFLIGCDPEFVAFDAEGQHVNVRYNLPHAGEIGWDHSGDVLEVRPRPAKSSFTLLKHIWDNLKNPNLLPKHKFRAGAYLEFPNKKVCLGGHVHLDLPFEIKSSQSRYRVLALDEITELFEQTDILPAKECEKRRKQGMNIMALAPGFQPYGAFGDVRKADTADRTEYRTMASWLYSPITSFLCLTAAKLAAFAPKETVVQLGNGAPSIGKVARYFEAFAGQDDDAKRVVERVLEPGLRLQRDPDANILESWKKELGSLAA